MTDEQKLTFLLKVLKQYAESKHCYEYNEEYRSDVPPNYPYMNITTSALECLTCDKRWSGISQLGETVYIEVK